MSPTEISAIERFIAMVKSESQFHGSHATNTVWVRMTLQDAQALTCELATAMNRLTQLEKDGMNISAAADGGTLR